MLDIINSDDNASVFVEFGSRTRARVVVNA